MYVAPAIKGFRALRVNKTAFNFTLEVFYTGGGDIKLFSIENSSNVFTLLTSVTPVQSQNSPQLWYAVITDPMFDGLEDPRLNINVTNAMDQSIMQQVQGEIGMCTVKVATGYRGIVYYHKKFKICTCTSILILTVLVLIKLN